MSETFDVVVIGAGTAGIPCAVHAADAGARVLLVEKDTRIGGTLHLSGGHMAAGGYRRQRERGIEDSPEAHLDDVRRISNGTARDDLVQIVVREAPATLDWLDDHGFAFAPETPRIIYGHEPYETPRTSYGTDEGVSVLDVLRPELERACAEQGLVLWTNAAVTEIVTDESGAVVGVEVYRDGRDVAVSAAAVVLATGGYGADPDLFAELEGAPLVSAAARTATGDGLHLGMSVGARLQGQGTSLPTFGGLPDPRTPGRANWSDRQRLTSERPPWEIYVDRHGRRWVAEDEESIDLKERALAEVADAWRRDWEHITPFLAVPEDLRRVVYTTNTIEAMHRQIRKAIKTRGHFPDQQAATKLIYLAIIKADAKWQRNRAWTAARAALKIHFGDRFPG